MTGSARIRRVQRAPLLGLLPGEQAGFSRLLGRQQPQTCERGKNSDEEDLHWIVCSISVPTKRRWEAKSCCSWGRRPRQRGTPSSRPSRTRKTWASTMPVSTEVFPDDENGGVLWRMQHAGTTY